MFSETLLSVEERLEQNLLWTFPKTRWQIDEFILHSVSCLRAVSIWIKDQDTIFNNLTVTICRNDRDALRVVNFEVLSTFSVHISDLW